MCRCAPKEADEQSGRVRYCGITKPFSEQGVDSMVATVRADSGAGRTGQRMSNTFRESHFYRKVFRLNKVMKCFVWKELELTAGELLRRKATKGRVAPLYAKQ